MSFERVHRSKSQSPQVSSSTSQFAPRPFSIREPKRLPTQEDIENEAFQQNKFEAFGLQLKEKHGTITPVEQERLGVLQAKMDGFWAQRMERAKAQPNFLEILIRNAQTTQATEPSAPVQPKLTIGAPNDLYEQEADRVASQVVEQIHAPATAQSTLGELVQQQEEDEELQAKQSISDLQRSPFALTDEPEEKPEAADLQAKSTLQHGIAVGEASTDLASAINSARGGGQPLDASLQGAMGQEKAIHISESEPTQHLDSITVLQSNTAETATIQRKGDQPLMTQIRNHKTLVGWAMSKIGDALTGYDPDLQPLFKKINDYDRSKDGRPRTQNAAIIAMVNDLQQWLNNNNAGGIQTEDVKNYTELNYILINERNITDAQAKRLEKYSADPNSPYQQMTDEGMLWSQAGLEHSTDKLGKTGKAYFEELSNMNVESIKKEESVNKLNQFSWYSDFVEAAKQALSNAVVNHYTTSVRVMLMLNSGMKSKIMLEKDIPTFKHNTSIYDDLGLANGGFLFFFIESPNAPLRGTRFAQGDDNADPARISIPIQESGLLTNGWIMLSDFAQREYPDIMTTNKGDEYTSWLPTRKKEQQELQPTFTKQVRHFEPGLEPLTENDIEKMASMTSSKRQAYSAVAPQASGDKDSKQVYTGPDLVGKLEIADRLFNNVLVGKDIIPGLAHRVGLEVARIYAVNKALGDKLSKLRGDELMLFILKDSFRPQAMIPNSLNLTEDYVQPHPRANQLLMEMTEKILDIGERLKKSDSEIMGVIDKKMTEIMYLGKHKMHEQVQGMKRFLEELQQRVPESSKEWRKSENGRISFM
ncbi:hypothetical protein IQ241_18215 [Romeria aff. gracilis LEGE 07310]|uniref:Uncharacterized protein n=1 Tax=Vasconcelosia minhoensis LEGE 07310 TaxID=915328 RepID=A0A8J7AAJ6_9CYAN|nr:hypothetical protein [Romeria gracilis]MBE9079210.1 hypothetical protein [Romeria aff. gracilis LEGE 07310]